MAVSMEFGREQIAAELPAKKLSVMVGPTPGRPNLASQVTE
jgi:hypothetical protein